ncbi:hypothetical protein VTK73DRAFT_3386 [Phialemonium thermophilum]|uniref:Attractin/MKLN-like beta-propeller domain-containing protein n=1 Tax=Phialemonium thermophilum TaxID=223376 RepID=A0ABR3WZN0_9PEZI
MRQSWIRLLQLLPTIFLLLLIFPQGSLQDRDPIKDFCRRFGHQTAVIDRKLYIDGGLVNWNPISSYPANYSNRALLYQDLDHNGEDGMPQLHANLSKSSQIPDVSGGVLWADEVNKRFYLFGGEYYQEPPAQAFTLYSFDTLENKWEMVGSPQGTVVSSVSYGAGVAVSERGEGYYYGGWLSNNSVLGWTGPPVATSTLIKYDMDSNSWTNNTGPDQVRRAEGVMVYIPAGDGGMLVYFGGLADLYLNGTGVGQPMDVIKLYDVLSSKWYTQTATGTIPGMRRRFCAGVTWPADQSSYNIYIYGGASMPPDTAGYDDVYVLTIPTFTWVKLYPTDGNVTGQYPHHSLTCNVVEGTQMLVIGGTFPLTEDCDAPTQWGTHNMDMGEQNEDHALWKLWDPTTVDGGDGSSGSDGNKTAYRVPDPIVAVVGGGPEGGATHRAPSTGFDAPDLKVLMTRTATLSATRSPTRPIPGATMSSSSTLGPHRSISSRAIAGIAVGGAVTLAAVAAVVWCIIRKRRRAGANGGNHAARRDDDPIGPGHSASFRSGPHTNVATSMSALSSYPPLPPPSPYLQRQHSPLPPGELAELSVGGGGASGAGAWLGADGVVYKLLSPSSSPSPGGGNGDVPPFKIDEHGRVVQKARRRRRRRIQRGTVREPAVSPTAGTPGA